MAGVTGVTGVTELPRNLKLTIEYDGTAYSGWQLQRDIPSVQGEIQRAAAEVVNHAVVIHGSGRTDRGVHALGQVANFKTSSAIACGNLLLGVNTHLPDDIRVREVEEVPPEFHARYSAWGKRYRYTILRSPIERVMVRRFCEVVRAPLDLVAMRAGAARLAGLHDFRAFQGNVKRRATEASGDPPSTVRTVLAVIVNESGPLVTIDAFGRGFLYGMVRAMAGTLLEVGRGRRVPEGVSAAIESRDRRRAGFTAAARGLCLIAVYYDSEKALEAVRHVAQGSLAEDRAGQEQDRLLKMLM